VKRGDMELSRAISIGFHCLQRPQQTRCGPCGFLRSETLELHYAMASKFSCNSKVSTSRMRAELESHSVKGLLSNPTEHHPVSVH
jgi:hypothetical protein